MSLRITRTGVFDSLQDKGRYGWQHLGINPGGNMDVFSAKLANALLGKELDAPVLELHFPSAQILFEKDTVICICGGDFAPVINNIPIPLHHPVVVAKGRELRFTRLQSGARTYLSILHDFKIDKWLNSYSTNIKASAGGWKGRALTKEDQLLFRNEFDFSQLLQKKDFAILPWKASETVDTRNEIEFLIGSEWHWLDSESQETFQNSWYQISNEADRMGYHMAGNKLELSREEQLVSSAVCYGTVQLLPSGQLIILMADHQTTGGYPRIAYIISAHLPILAQKKPNDVVRFKMTGLEPAEEKMMKQFRYLEQLQVACRYRMEERGVCSL